MERKRGRSGGERSGPQWWWRQRQAGFRSGSSGSGIISARATSTVGAEEHRSASLTAVQKAIRSGRISPTAEGMLDSDWADAELKRPEHSRLAAFGSRAR